MSLLALVLIGVVVLIALKSTGVLGKSVTIPYPTVTVRPLHAQSTLNHASSSCLAKLSLSTANSMSRLLAWTHVDGRLSCRVAQWLGADC